VTALSALVLAAIAVAPADRLSMADRLFNRGAYEDALAEYQALRGENVLPYDDLLYRLAECDRALGRNAAARASYGELLANYPASRHADRARLMCALAGTDDEKRSELRVLDSDRVAADIRSAALYHLGVLNSDVEAFERCVTVSPKGRYAPYAKLRRASLLAASKDAQQRRQAVRLLLEIAFGGEGEFSEEALFLAATTSYGEKRYGETATLLRRYMKQYKAGKHIREAVAICAWCEYLNGKYADAITLCGAGDTEDTAFLLAAATHASGDMAKSKPLFEAYIEKYPQGRYRRDVELPLARLGFAEAEKSGDSAMALECARRAAAISGTASDRLRVAWACEKCGDVEGAEREYVAVAADFPGTSEAAEAMFRKALADLREERWSAAELSLAEALGGSLEDRRRAEALYWRGIAAIRMGHEEEGVEHLRSAIEKGLNLDQSREARLLIADCDYNAGRRDEAKQAYSRLIKEGAAARMSAAKTLAVGKLLFPGEEALICAAALVKIDSPEWRQAGFALRGAVEEDAKSYAAAIESYRRCLAENCKTEDLPRAAARLGALEAANGEWDAAGKTLARAVELNSENVEVRAECYLHLAEVAVAKGNVKDARAYATVVVTLFESSPFAKGAADILAEIPEDAK
jgi:tetratricopeptide (TPR) repeat protein